MCSSSFSVERAWESVRLERYAELCRMVRFNRSMNDMFNVEESSELLSASSNRHAAAIVLGCDEVAVPTQQRSGCGNGRNLGQHLAAQSLSLDGEPAPVVVREPETLAPKPGSEHTVLLSQVINHILLLAVDPASQNEQ